MQLSSILSHIPFLRNLSQQSSESSSQSQTASSQNEANIRKQAIEDSIEISSQAAQALSQLDTSSELPEEDVSRLVQQTRSFLESNDNANIGLNAEQARGL